MKQTLNATEVAKLLKVDRATVSRWIKQGRLAAIKTKQQWKVPITAYQKLLQQPK